jgi:hypothetical protein
MTPVPMMAMRRMGMVCDMSLRQRRCQSGYPARVEEIAFTGSIEPRGLDRGRKVTNMRSFGTSSVMPILSMRRVTTISGSADLLSWRRAIDRVAARRVAAVHPVENPVLELELEVDRLRQSAEEGLDVGPGRSRLAGEGFDIGREDAAEPGIVGALFASSRSSRISDRSSARRTTASSPVDRHRHRRPR